MQVFSRIGPFDCAWKWVLRMHTMSWYHVNMLPCCHLDTSRTRGQQEDKKRSRTAKGGRRTRKRTTGGQDEDKERARRGQKERNRDGLAAAPAWKKHKKRTTGGHRVHWRGQAGHQQRRRRGQSEDIHCFPASRTALILLKWLW